MAKYNANERKKNATYVDSQGKAKFPIGDKTHARLALNFIKDAPPNERGKIRTKADKMLGKKK